MIFINLGKFGNTEWKSNTEQWRLAKTEGSRANSTKWINYLEWIGHWGLLVKPKNTNSSFDLWRSTDTVDDDQTRKEVRFGLWRRDRWFQEEALLLNYTVEQCSLFLSKVGEGKLKNATFTLNLWTMFNIYNIYVLCLFCVIVSC